MKINRYEGWFDTHVVHGLRPLVYLLKENERLSKHSENQFEKDVISSETTEYEYPFHETTYVYKEMHADDGSGMSHDEMVDFIIGQYPNLRRYSDLLYVIGKMEYCLLEFVKSFESNYASKGNSTFKSFERKNRKDRRKNREDKKKNREDTPGTIEQIKQFLIKEMSFDIGNDLIWNDLKYYFILRNHIIHNDGYIQSNKVNKEFLSWIDTRVHLDLRDSDIKYKRQEIDYQEELKNRTKTNDELRVIEQKIDQITNRNIESYKIVILDNEDISALVASFISYTDTLEKEALKLN